MSEGEKICKKCQWGRAHHRKEVLCPRQGWIKVDGRDSAFSNGGEGYCIMSAEEKEGARK